MNFNRLTWFVILCIAPPFAFAEPTRATLTGLITSDGRQPLAARLYIRATDGKWHHAKSSAPDGTAVVYEKIRGKSQESHTTLSAHPFQANLPPGKYTLTVERGKEYHPLIRQIEILPATTNKPTHVDLHLRRWANMADRNWYSGDTHVHRTMADLPNVVLAEDLNVALPLTFWVTDSRETPARNNKNREAVPPPSLIEVDATHVIWPINTEYEIFSVAGKRHTLGAVFMLNHTRPLNSPAPTVSLAAKEARAQNADVLLDLDKHNWPWSLMLPPVAKVDLFELSNNHIWRTEFLFRDWYSQYAAKYMNLDYHADGGFTERGWRDFGFQTYYALLNCGFAMQPTAGTASGVHPVPLGFGRVYVQLEDGFEYRDWIDGLKRGRSFVTTGPMLTATFNGQSHGSVFSYSKAAKPRVKIVGNAESLDPTQFVEIIVNGRVERLIDAKSAKSMRTKRGGFRLEFETEVQLVGSSWIALRCFEKREHGRLRFAHTSPVHIKVAGKPLQPAERQVRYLLSRVEEEIERNRGVIADEALEEFEAARRHYTELLPSKRKLNEIRGN